jgi:hypothetical protein
MGNLTHTNTLVTDRRPTRPRLQALSYGHMADIEDCLFLTVSFLLSFLLLCHLSQSQSYFTTDGQSVSLGVEPNLGLLTRDNFFFLKVTVLSFGGALSDERSGLSSVSPLSIKSVVVSMYLQFTLCWSWSYSCCRQSVDQCVWVSGLPLGSLTWCYLSLFSSCLTITLFWFQCVLSDEKTSL